MASKTKRWSIKARFREFRRQELMTYAGLILSNFPSGCLYFYGNLLTYTDSYQRVVLKDRSITNATSLIICAYNIPWVIAIVFTDKLVKICGSQRLLFFFSCLCYDASFLLGYWTVQHSTLTLILVQGILPGICVGINLAVSLQLCVDWSAGRKLGLITGLTTNSFVGYTLISLLVTAYINPENLTPELKEGEQSYFDQPPVLQRTPSVFFVLAGFFVCFHVVGNLLIRTPPVTGKEKSLTGSQKSHLNTVEETVNLKDEDSAEEKDTLGSSSRLTSCTNNKEAKLLSSTETNDDEMGVEINQYPRQSYSSIKETSQVMIDKEFSSEKSLRYEMASPVSDLDKSSWKETHDNVKNSEPTPDTEIPAQEDDPSARSRSATSLSFISLLRDPCFLTLWLTGATGEYSILCLTAFYKSFGQEYIKDDHFLAVVATCLSITIGLARIAWGIFVDTYGVKNSIVALMASCTTIPLFWFLSAFLDKWAYLLTSCAMAGSSIGVFGIMSVSVYRCFGDSQFSYLYGLSLIPDVVITLVFPVISAIFLEYLGWFYIFLIAVLVNLVGLIFTVVTFPNNI